jgi:hypothetical protein
VRAERSAGDAHHTCARTVSTDRYTQSRADALVKAKFTPPPHRWRFGRNVTEIERMFTTTISVDPGRREFTFEINVSRRSGDVAVRVRVPRVELTCRP